MGQLVQQKLKALGAREIQLTGVEPDLMAHGERPRLGRLSEPRRLGVLMHTDVAEIMAKHGAEPRHHRRGQGPTAAGT
jgi:hypothetical protein